MPDRPWLHRRIPVWIDATMAEALARVAIPGTHPATLLRLLLRAVLRELDTLELTPGARQIAPLVWAAVAPRRRRPAIIEALPRLVDEYLESLGASYAMRAKVYAILLGLSHLQRLLLLAEGSRATATRRAPGELSVDDPAGEEAPDES